MKINEIKEAEKEIEKLINEKEEELKVLRKEKEEEEEKEKEKLYKQWETMLNVFNRMIEERDRQFENLRELIYTLGGDDCDIYDAIYPA